MYLKAILKFNNMILKGKKILLRAPEPQDVEVLYLWENDPEIWKISNTQAPYSKYVLEQYILNSHEDIYKVRQLRLMIDLIGGENPNVTIGAIDLFDFEPAHHRAGIGILIDKNARKAGYATEALDLLVDYCFSILHLHQIYCNIGVDNVQSLALFQKFGFQIIGVKKDWIFTDNQWQDEYILQLIHTHGN